MSRPALREVAGLFFRVGNAIFGSGSATIILLSREMNDRGWLSRAQTDLYYTLVRIVPGTNVMAFVAAVGYAVRGWAGMLAAILSLSVPASAIVILITLAYQQWHGTYVGGHVITAAMCAIVGVIIAAGCLLAFPRFTPGRRIRTVSLVMISAVLSIWLAPLSCVLIAAAVGFLWPERR